MTKPKIGGDKWNKRYIQLENVTPHGYQSKTMFATEKFKEQKASIIQLGSVVPGLMAPRARLVMGRSFTTVECNVGHGCLPLICYSSVLYRFFSCLVCSLASLGYIFV